MDTPSAYTRNMYQQYRKQILTSRTMAYHQRARRLATGEEPEILPEVKRRMMVNRVAREVFTNLLVIGTDSPLVREVQHRLEADFEAEYQFCYVPGNLDVVIYRKSEKGMVELDERERIEVTNRAWEITIQVVDSYML